jgi:dipeptidyl aminopeptidase/acylaminoacyl peptidase
MSDDRRSEHAPASRATVGQPASADGVPTDGPRADVPTAGVPTADPPTGPPVLADVFRLEPAGAATQRLAGEDPTVRLAAPRYVDAQFMGAAPIGVQRWWWHGTGRQRGHWSVTRANRVGSAPFLGPSTTDLIRLIATAPGAWCPSLSPDGRRVAYVTDRSGVPRLEVAPVTATGTDGDGRPVGAIEAVGTISTAGAGGGRAVSPSDQEAISVAWSPDGEHLAYLVSPAGSIRAELHVSRPDGTERRLLLGGGEFETVFAGGWVGPRTYACSLADGRSPDAVVCLVDVDSGAVHRVPATEGGGFFVVTSVSRDGRWLLARRGPRGARHLVLAAVHDPDAPLVRVLAADFPEGGDLADLSEDGRFSPDGRTIFLRSNAGRERLALASVELDEHHRPGPLRWHSERDDADLEAYAIFGAGRLALTVWNVGGRSELQLRDLAGLRPPVPIELPQPVLPGWSLQGDGAAMVVELTGPRAPRSLYRVNLEPTIGPLLAVSGVDGGAVVHTGGVNDGTGSDGASTVLAPDRGGVATRPTTLPTTLPSTAGPAPTEVHTVVRRLPSMPSVDALPALVTPTLHRYESIDGTPLEGWLYRPANAHGPEPTVISLHGGPEGQERSGYGLLNQSLAAAGLTVFAPNVRGSSGYGRSFTESDDGDRRATSFQDVPATVAFLAESGLARPGAVGVYGWSYGGYLALTALSRWPDLFAAGATHAGMSDLHAFFAETEPWMAAASTLEYGDPVTQADLLTELSPMTTIGRVRVPVLLVHGSADTNVPVQESIRAHEALQAFGVPTDLLLLEGEGHTIVQAAHRAELALNVAAWFTRWLS